MQTIQKADHSVVGGFAGAATNGLEERNVATIPASAPSSLITASSTDEARGQ